jgi:acyl transferase domain-containing protein
MQPVAIIGMSCRFPGSPSPDHLWELLAAGSSAVGPLPPGRWDAAAVYDPDPMAAGKTNALRAGYLERIDEFDHGFFGISAREAAWMDPQQRLTLEVATEALEDAGLPAEALAGSRTGVFMAATSNDQGFHLADRAVLDEVTDVYAAMGYTLNLIPGRIAYVFDLKGPNLSIDSACSSSLLAVHLACQSLAMGDADMALAGGVSLMHSPVADIILAKTRAFAPDGRCKAFDARADGFVRGEGAGVLVLKRLDRALADGDRVHAVIAGSAVVQDGRSNGLTAPNGLAQEQLVRQALRAAGVTARDIGYVEAHGTGTALGDPIEMIALGRAFRDQRDTQDKCPVGSIKTNIGHLEAAAGVAGLIKVVLAMVRRELPPSLHFESPNPDIPFAELPLRVQTQRGPWPDRPGPLLAGVSSFGWSGTNCHVIVREAPTAAPGRAAALPGAQAPDRVGARADAGEPHVLLLSATSAAALHARAAAMQAHLGGLGDDAQAVRDVTHTAALRRTHHAHRLAVVGTTAAQLADALDAFQRDAPVPGVVAGRKPASRVPRVAFVFSGHGAEWSGMGRELLRTRPVFRQTMERCDAAIQAHAGFSPLAELAAAPEQERWHRTGVVQPVLFAMQVALAALWRSLGVEPDAVIGHSMGEVAAACCAGALTIEDGARVICARSRLLQTLEGTGAMAVVELGVDEAGALLAERGVAVGIAASTSRRTTVLSGNTDALVALVAELNARGVYAKRIDNASAAGHSTDVVPLQPLLRRALAGLRPSPTEVPMLSTVTGERIDGAALDADYWARNLREPVVFARALERLARSGHRVLVEISPHPLLCGAIGDDLAALGIAGHAVSSLRRNAPEHETLLAALGQVHCLGVAVSWSRVRAVAEGRLVSLPPYPWQRTHFPLLSARRRDRAVDNAGTGEDARARPLLGPPMAFAPTPGTIVWPVHLDRATTPALLEHVVDGAATLSPSLYLTLARAIAEDVLGAVPCAVADLALHRVLPLRAGASPRLQAVMVREPGRDPAVAIYGQGAAASDRDDWQVLASWRLRPAPDRRVPGPSAVSRERPADDLEQPGHALYQALAALGATPGPALRSVAALTGSAERAVADLAAPDAGVGPVVHTLDPALIEGCFHLCDAVALAGMSADAAGAERAFIGTSIAAVHVFGPTSARMRAHARVVVRTAGRIEIDVSAWRDDGGLALELIGVRFQRLDELLPAVDVGAGRPAGSAMSDTMSDIGERDPGLSERLRAAAPGPERQAVVRDLVATMLARALQCRPDELDPEQPLTSIGLDSLMALDVRNQLARALAMSLPATLLLRNSTIDGVSAHLAVHWRPDAPGAQRDTSGPLAGLPASGGDAHV